MENYGNIENKYLLIKKLGWGANCVVYLVKEKDTNKEYAAKVLNNEENNTTEIDINLKISSLKNKYIMNLVDKGIGTIVKKGKIFENKHYYIFEYASKGDLFMYIPFLNKIKNEKFFKILAKKILIAIKELHENNICHLDIKLDNILLDDNFNPKICDFGVSEIINDENKGKFHIRKGTINYFPPQMFLNEILYDGFKADIFCLGVTLFYIVTGRKCFEDSSEEDIYYNHIRKGTKEEIDKYWEEIEKLEIYVKDSFKKLFIDMVSFNEEKRPSIKEILNYEWFEEINSLNNEQEINLNENYCYIFSSIQKVVKEKLEEIDYIELKSHTISLDKESYYDNDDNNSKIFKEGIYAENKEPKMNIGKFIKIKGNLNAINFMNNILNTIKDSEENEYEINLDDKILKFNIIIKKGNKKKYYDDYLYLDKIQDINEDLEIKIKLFKISDGYLLRFTKRKGEISNYYRYLIKFIDIVKEEINSY